MRQLLALACLALLASTGCLGRTPWEIQRDYANTLRPQEVAAPAAAPEAPVQALKLRVYVDEEYRAHVLGWQTKIGEQVERANQVLAPAFHVRFVPEIRPWQRAGGSRQLEAALVELEQTDPGSDVDWVLGLTGVLPLASADLHRIGLARRFSKHMVEHAMDDAAEGAAINRGLGALSDEERFALYRDRKRHKEMVVLLHEWAHTLGAVHTRRDSDLLLASYDNHQSAFGPPNAALIESNLRARLAHPELPPDNPEARAVMRRALEGGCPTCDPADLALALGQTQAPAPAAAPTLAAAPAPAPADPDRAALQQAQGLLDHGDAAGAWAQAAPLAARRGDLLAAQVLACAAGVSAKQADARAPCRRWTELAPGSAADLALAWAEFRADDRQAASERLAGAQEKLALERAPAASSWLDAAHLAQNLVAITVAERAAAHLADEAEAARLRGWSRTNRRRLGLPPDAGRFGIDPAQEPAFAAAVQAASAELGKGDLRAADRTIAAGLGRWPGAPGLLAARCQLREGRGEKAGARADCEAAARAYDEAVWAHFDLGILAMEARDLERAAAHLERVVALDPTIKSGWQNLLQVRQAQRNSSAVEQLRQRYQQQFGAPP